MNSVLNSIKRWVTRTSIIAYLVGSVFLNMPAMCDLNKGCTENAIVDLDRSLLLEEKRQDQEEDALEDAEKYGQQDVQEYGQECLNSDQLKAMVKQRLTLLLREERRAVLAHHLPEHIYTVLRRVKRQHAKLYQELAIPKGAGSSFGQVTPEELRNGPHQEAYARRESQEREFMSIMLHELCVQLGQEGQDLDELFKREEGSLGSYQWYWRIMGAFSLVVACMACYAPFAPCVP